MKMDAGDYMQTNHTSVLKTFPEQQNVISGNQHPLSDKVWELATSAFLSV